MGKATILFHIVLILMQFIILGRDFKIKNLFQLGVAVVFGYFTTFSIYLIDFLPVPETWAIRIVLLLISILLVAVGIFFYLPPDLIPLAGEGVMQAVSQKTGIAFPRVKVTFDICMVLISGITCLLFLHGFGSIGAGTVISAVLVGSVLSVIMKLFKDKLDEILNNDYVCMEAEAER